MRPAPELPAAFEPLLCLERDDPAADPAAACGRALAEWLDAQTAYVAVELPVGRRTVARVIRGSATAGDILETTPEVTPDVRIDGSRVEVVLGSGIHPPIVLHASGGSGVDQAELRVFERVANFYLAARLAARRELLADRALRCGTMSGASESAALCVGSALELLGFEEAEVYAATGRRLAAVPEGGRSTPGPLSGLAKRALALGRLQYADASVGLARSPAIAAPFEFGTERGVLVVRGRDLDPVILPYELELVAAAAEHVRICLLGSEARRQTGRSRALTALVSRLSTDPLGAPAVDALLAGFASDMGDTYGASLVFLSVPSEDGRVVWLADDEIDVVPIAEEPSLADELAPGRTLVVDRTTMLRAAEESPLHARGMRSYAAVATGAGTGGVLGVAAERDAAFAGATLDELAVAGALVGQVLARLRIHSEVAMLGRRIKAVRGLTERLVTSVSHQFRTPLTSIRGFARTVIDAGQDGLPWEQQEEFLSIVAQRAAQLERLLDNFVLLAELELGTYRTAPEPIDADSLVTGLVGEMTVEDGPSVVTSGEAGTVRVDAAALRTILANLLDNALRHARSHVRVRTSVAGNEFVLEVDDDGPGIPAAERQNVLAAFTSDEDPANPTVGLGLTVVVGLTNLLGGHFELTDASAGGLTARLVFPAVSEGRST